MTRLAGIACLLWAMLATAVQADAAPTPATASHVTLETDRGIITLQLLADKSPLTVANFLAHVDSGFYDGTLFHRAIRGFIIQGGGFTAGMVEKPAHATVANESRNRASNRQWTVAMARTDDPDSAGSQFFINLGNNTELDFRFGRPGYAVFAEVIDGRALLEAAASEPTARHGIHDDVPLQPLRILRAYRGLPATRGGSTP